MEVYHGENNMLQAVKKKSYPRKNTATSGSAIKLSRLGLVAGRF
jgi:hypothetical protein